MKKNIPNSTSVEIPEEALTSTGERLIPALDRGASYFYEHLARYLFSNQFVKNKTVLDVACGSGYGTFILSKYGEAKKVVGLDISEEAITYANSTYKTKNNTYFVDDAEIIKTQENHSFDVCVSFETIEHLVDQKNFLNQVKRVLKPNGIFVVSTPNKYTYPKGNAFHTNELFPEEFQQLISMYFKNIRCYHQSFEVAQMIKKQDAQETFKLEESWSVNSGQIYSSIVDPKSSQYLVAVCSNSTLPECNLMSINTTKVDGFDLSEGILSLSKQFQVGIDLVNNERTNNSVLKKRLLELQASLIETKKLDKFEIDALNVHLLETNRLCKQKLLDIQTDLAQLNLTVEKNLALREEISEVTKEVQGLELLLNKLRSSKFFKLWQLFNKLKMKNLK